MTKLYHHVKLLEQVELIVDVETRVVSGIVEHRYQSGQMSLHFDESMFGSPATRDASIRGVAAFVEESRDELVDYLSGPDADVDAIFVSKSYARLTQHEARAVMAELCKLVDGFRPTKVDPTREDLPRTSMLFLLHPLAGSGSDDGH